MKHVFNMKILNQDYKHYLVKYARTREGKNLIPATCGLLMARNRAHLNT